MRVPIAVVVALLLSLLAPVETWAQKVAPPKADAYLLMVDAPDCGWCRKWDRDVGGAYGKTEEGRLAPLVRVQRGDKRLAGIPGLAYTPTFVLMVNGVEQGRIVGYKGVDFFWGELGQMLKRASVTAAAPAIHASMGAVPAS